MHDGFVINTQSYGGGKFPERAVRGMPVDSVAAYLRFCEYTMAEVVNQDSRYLQLPEIHRLNSFRSATCAIGSE